MSYQLNRMSSLAQQSEKYIKSREVRTVNTSRINLPPAVLQNFLKLIRKYNGQVYGSAVTAFGNNNSRMSNDVDFYIAETNRNRFLAELMRIYPHNIRTRHNDDYNITKIEYKMPNGRYVELGDMAVKHETKCNTKGCRVTDDPFQQNTRQPVQKYGNIKGDSQQAQFLKKINATQYDSNKRKTQRYGKDSWDVAYYSRLTVTQLLKEYQKRPTPELKKYITKLFKEITLYSTDRHVMQKRLEFERFLISKGYTNIKFFSAQNRQNLTEIKKKLVNGTFDLDKDLLTVKKIVTPEPVVRKKEHKLLNSKVLTGKIIRKKKTAKRTKKTEKKVKKGLFGFPDLKIKF